MSDQASREAILVEVPDLQVVSGGCANLLGSPIGGLESIDKVLREKSGQLRLMGGRLPHLHLHDALLLLLRHSFVIPKLLYIMRTSPCFLSAELEVYDNLLKTILCDVTNVRLDEVSWSQASLPIRSGGIGVRRVAQLAPSAFLASAAGCSDLIRLILPSYLQNVSYPTQESALDCWQCGHDEPPPSSLAAHRQKVWDSPRIQATYFPLLDALPDPRARVCLLAVTTKKSGDWLNALPTFICRSPYE